MESTAQQQPAATDGQIAALRINRRGDDLRLGLALNANGDVSGVTRLARVESLTLPDLEKRVRDAILKFGEQIIEHILAEHGYKRPQLAADEQAPQVSGR